MPTFTTAEVRRNLAAWLDHWIRTNTKGVHTREALAKRLGVTKSALTPWFREGSTTLPRGETLVAIRNLVDWPLDVILFTPFTGDVRR